MSSILKEVVEIRKNTYIQTRRNSEKGKESILSIQNTDSLCLPRAIVVARLHSKKPQDPGAFNAWQKQWKRIQEADCRSAVQKKQALELMELAGVIQLYLLVDL